MDLFSIFSQRNRRRSISAALAMTAVIAVADWLTTPYIAIGFLYLFPIILISGFVRRRTIVVFAVVCAVLQEAFSNLPASDEFTRLILSLAGFSGTGLFIHAMTRNRQMTLEHLAEVENQMRLRRDAEEQLQVLVDTSPAAIVILDGEGTILMANKSSRQMLVAGDEKLVGRSMADYLPALYGLGVSHRSLALQTAVQCRGRRKSGEVFLAGVWVSAYETSTGRKLAAIIVDISDDLRDREDLSLDYLLKNAHILMSALTHEIGNLSSATEVFYRNLERSGALAGNHDFEALGRLIEGLSKLSAMELMPVSQRGDLPSVELGSIMDELRILIGSTSDDSGITLDWRVADELPMVVADRYGLMQVFLNLVKNSRRAMEESTHKQLTFESVLDSGVVEIRVKDTGPGITNPHNLFRPFQRDAETVGLGLFVSRVLMRSFGGDLIHEPSSAGCCFALILRKAE
jgi:two-component system, LuxR family, sensor kinase FixL